MLCVISIVLFTNRYGSSQRENIMFFMLIENINKNLHIILIITDISGVNMIVHVSE